MPLRSLKVANVGAFFFEKSVYNFEAEAQASEVVEPNSSSVWARKFLHFCHLAYASVIWL